MTSESSLNNYFEQINAVILCRQNPVTGLLPASTAINTHGNYTDAWVRDNVYSIFAVWGLAIAYRNNNGDRARAYLLEQSVVKLMRGLLQAMMRQANKVERFKYTLDPLDCLHAKYDTPTGDTIVGDHEWGHLQIDATSLFLLMTAQMTASGLRIIFTLDEVNFIQNLVHYISRAYRTPDYGIWERGHKINSGLPELNASSVGMAKAALEALSGFNVFGEDGGQASIIHVMSDDIARNRITLESLLPRESVSKEVDSAVLSVIGFPSFAVENEQIAQDSEQLIIDKLQGVYGCKRFLLDGHQTLPEDSHRLHYEAHELKQFMHIECEWPLFFCYLFLNKLFAGEQDAAKDYLEKLQDLMVEQDGMQLLPELYIVPEEQIEAERQQPGTVKRKPNENIPLVWAQSLFLVGSMMKDGLLSPGDIDPLGRHQRQKSTSDRNIVFVLIAEDDQVQQQLGQHQLNAQTLEQIKPVHVRESGELANAYTQVGKNRLLGLSGRPNKQIRTLGTALSYRFGEENIVFLPQFMNPRGFYLALDTCLLVERLHSELRYIYNHWDREGQPLMFMLIQNSMLNQPDSENLLKFLNDMQHNRIPECVIQQDTLPACLSQVSTERIDFLHDFSFATETVFLNRIQTRILQVPSTENTHPVDEALLADWKKLGDDAVSTLLFETDNLYAQYELLHLLYVRHGKEYKVRQESPEPVSILLEEVYSSAANLHNWSLLRLCAALLEKYDVDLEQSATEILVRQKRLSVGQEYSNRATFTRPANSKEILTAIQTYNVNNISVHIIIQELIIYLGVMIKSDPQLFTDMRTVRVGHIMRLIIVRYCRDHDYAMEDTLRHLIAEPPHIIAGHVKATLTDYNDSENQLNIAEALHYTGICKQLTSARFSERYNPKDRGNALDWHEWREQQGSIGRQPEEFFASVWRILQHSQALIIGDQFNHKRRLDSAELLAQMTDNEQSFELLINHRLDQLQSPDFRQLTVETLYVLAILFKDNPQLYIDGTLSTDTLISHAVRLSWRNKHPERPENAPADQALSWQDFYQLMPNEVANGILLAFDYLLGTQNNNKGEEA